MENQDSLRIVLCGTVHCTELIAKKLVEHNARLVAVAGVKPEYSKSISGYVDMSVIASELNVPYYAFKNINESGCIEFIQKVSPDILFVTGLSQLVKDELMSVPRIGIVGFHPTPLPKGRGRAPIAWLAHDSSGGAATFFTLGNGVDNGDIFVQEHFTVNPDDHALDVEAKILLAAGAALDRWLPQLIQGEWNPVPQDESLATYNEIRKPDDGIIDWTLPVNTVYALIRAASHPHPGAYTFIEERKILIWKAEIDKTSHIRGVPGRILRIEGNQILVQTGNGLLIIKEWEMEDNAATPALRIGMRLGYNVQNEIYDLRQRITKMEKLLETLTAECQKPKNNSEEKSNV